MHNDVVDFGDDKVRMNVEEDRLSRLSDDLIHKVLSFTSLTEAIGMSVLSSRWRFVWTSMPYLNFINEDCHTLPPDFSKFVSNVLSRRNNEIQVSSVKLVLRGRVSLEFFKTVVNYLVSHNLQQLSVTRINDVRHYMGFNFPLFSSLSLKHLSLRGYFYASDSTMATTTWQLPALTTLHLDTVTLLEGHTDKYTGLFSKLPNLMNHRGNYLSSATLEQTDEYVEGFGVVAPQLENLTVINCLGKHLISAPKLTSLPMKGFRSGGFFEYTQVFPSLEKLDICIEGSSESDADRIYVVLLKLPSVKFLTLDFGILMRFSFMRVAGRLSWLANLKILKFLNSNPARVYLEVQAQEKDNGISLVDICTYKFVKLMEGFVFAQKRMDKTGVLLKTGKANSDINKAQMEKANAPAKTKRYQHSTLETQWHFWEIIAQVEQGNNHLPTSEAFHMILCLHDIEVSLTRLPCNQHFLVCVKMLPFSLMI